MSDYDPTLARVAGNIAAAVMQANDCYSRDDKQYAQNIADKSVSIASAIVRRCQQIQQEQVSAVVRRLSK